MVSKPIGLLDSEGGPEWTAEIQEAMEARKQAEERLKLNPRPRPPRGMMQRGTSSTQTKVRSTTHTIPIDTNVRS
jgi:hypothetical protein